jgi:hypothetical protein
LQDEFLVFPCFDVWPQWCQLRKKGNNSHQAIQSTPANKVTTGAVESQQSVPVHEKSNFNIHRVANVPEDEGLSFVHCFTLASDFFSLHVLKLWRGALVQRLSCCLVTMRSWVQLLETTSCRNAGKDAYIRPKVVKPCASGGYVHRAALYIWLNNLPLNLGNMCLSCSLDWWWFLFLSEEFLSVYIGNLSPSTSVFDLEKVFKTFGRIKPDGVAIRSRKVTYLSPNAFRYVFFIADFLILSALMQEAGVFFGFVEFEDHSGINNALNVSFP